MIKLQAIGHLGKDCVVNNVNGKTVINFSVAHTEKFKNAQGVQNDKTIWVECSWWTERTGIAPYLKKGTQIFVDGAPELRQYTTKEGKAGSSLGLRVSFVQLLGSSERNEGSSTGQSSYFNQVGHGQANNATDITEPMDDLPF